VHAVPVHNVAFSSFIPAGKYLSIYQKANASGAGDDKNLTVWDVGRGFIHSSASQLNLSRFCLQKPQQASMFPAQPERFLPL